MEAELPEPVTITAGEVRPTITVALVVAFLGIIALATVVGGIVLAYGDRTVPDSIIAIGSASGGALAAVLARTDRS